MEAVSHPGGKCNDSWRRQVPADRRRPGRPHPTTSTSCPPTRLTPPPTPCAPASTPTSPTCTISETPEAELQALATGTGHADDIDLLDELPELPELTGRPDGLPEYLQAELSAAFDIQVVWNQPMNQVTFHAAITELLTHTGGDPTSATTGPTATQTPATRATPRQDSLVSASCGKATPIMELALDRAAAITGRRPGARPVRWGRPWVRLREVRSWARIRGNDGPEGHPGRR